jgi:hypothetical protein
VCPFSSGNENSDGKWQQVCLNLFFSPRAELVFSDQVQSWIQQPSFFVFLLLIKVIIDFKAPGLCIDHSTIPASGFFL